MPGEPLDRALVGEVDALFTRHGIAAPAAGARRIVMVSTHGYRGDPPPAGATDTGARPCTSCRSPRSGRARAARS